MCDFAIRAENLSKRYRIGQRDRYIILRGKNTLRDKLAGALYAPFRRVLQSLNGNSSSTIDNQQPDDIWALKDISFGVKHGEVVGFIGHNGAGKSTLLKILSRITEPTEGYADIYGRVGSLLEVGTGFHSELTGRENIYLSGAILGMKKAEIDRKFDEIVAFSEVEKFIDTPVKHYSSGMSVRLAFAVAAHLEPEIIIVDEVLAVGDAAFQKKCLAKMDNVAKEGRTVLFVSHNMPAVQSLCSRVIWLKNGRIERDGDPDEVVLSYLQTTFPAITERLWNDKAEAPGDDRMRLHRACIRPVDGSPSDPITARMPFVIEFEYWNLKPGAYLDISLQLYNEQGIVVFKAGPVQESARHPLPVGLFRDVCHVPGNLLKEGMYRVVLHAITDKGAHMYLEKDILVFNIQDKPELHDGLYSKWDGIIRPNLRWDRELIELDKLP
jgi:lipopolysaccharide transport system ATP-binding protein